VDVALNQADLMAKLIVEEMSLGDMMTLVKLRKGEVSIVEEKIVVGAMARKLIAIFLFTSGCTALASGHSQRRGDYAAWRHASAAHDEVLAVVRTEQRRICIGLLTRH